MSALCQNLGGVSGGQRAIELKLKDVSQLFHTLDPSSFRNRDLAEDVVDFILDWTHDLPKRQDLQIVIHLPQSQCGSIAVSDIGGAISAYFLQRARRETNNIRQLLRSGRYGLALGLGVLSICLVCSWYLASDALYSPLSRILSESLVIVGWVAIWQPAGIFLYEWIPHASQRKLFRRLAAASVTLCDMPRSLATDDESL